jgi:hypothetical protein
LFIFVDYWIEAFRVVCMDNTTRTTTKRLVVSMRASQGEMLMSAVISAQQYQDGGKIALVYTDGSCEIGASLGKKLDAFGTLFEVVRHVQEQRPATVMTIPEALGPSTMSESEAR